MNTPSRFQVTFSDHSIQDCGGRCHMDAIIIATSRQVLCGGSPLVEFVERDGVRVFTGPVHLSLNTLVPPLRVRFWESCADVVCATIVIGFAWGIAWVLARAW